MDKQASIEQVAGILHREGLDFDTHADGQSYRLWFGRDAVFVHVGDDHVDVSSPALQELDDEDAGYAVLLNRLNDLNAGRRFIKWVLVDDSLVAARHLLRDDLRAASLLHAVHGVAAAVRETADELEAVTGGVRYDEVAQA